MSKPKVLSQCGESKRVFIALLFLLAVGSWGLLWWQRSNNAPGRAHVEAGIKFLEHGQGAAAEKEWKRAIILDPRNVQAWELLGDYYLIIGDNIEAREAFNRVFEIQPQTGQLHFRIAMSNARLGDLKQARYHAEEELKSDPDHVGAMEILTGVLSQTGEQQDLRLKYLRHLVKLQPKNKKFVAELADVLVAQKKYNEALPVIEELLLLDPSSGPAYAMRGAAVLYTDPSREKLSGAINDLKKALSYDPSDAVARLFLGKVYLRLGQPRIAIAEIRKLEGLPSAHESYLLELANAYRMLGDIPKVKAMRARYAAIEDRNVQVRRLQSKLNSNPQDFEAVLGIGRLLLESPKPMGAEDYINKALKLRPTDRRAQQALQKLEARYSGYLKEAAKALARNNYVAAGHSVGRAMLLRPNDPRTIQALQHLERSAIPADGVRAGPDK
jgi:tetratricopeptide (TPR) repeat protein